MTVKAFGLEKCFPITFQKCKIDPVQVVRSNAGLELIKIEDLKVDLNDGVFVEHSAVALFEHEIASCPLIGREGTPSHTHTHMHSLHCQTLKHVTNVSANFGKTSSFQSMWDQN